MGSPPHLVVEFESRLASRFERSAESTLVVGSVAVLVFLILCFTLLKILSHRDELMLRLDRERHLSTLGEMSAVLAHEIRNPLASLKGNAQLLAEGLARESPEHAKVTRIVGEAVRLEQLTTDLLAFVRSGKINAREIDPAKLLRTAADMVESSRISIQSDRAPASWRLDPDRMQQVLINVLTNAVHASPERAQVEASVHGDKHELVIEIRDHGDGIPAGDVERIFEPFVTKKVRGTGLGLAIARRIVEAHGGRISAKNHPTGGAVFRISLPEA